MKNLAGRIGLRRTGRGFWVAGRDALWVFVVEAGVVVAAGLAALAVAVVLLAVV